MIEIQRYKDSDKSIWNEFIDSSKVDTFLFNRDFLDYHSNRFKDLSFLIFRKGKLEALLPGNISGNTFYSHEGLTYGGLIASFKMSTTDILSSFHLINTELKSFGISDVIYKPLPYIYHFYPNQEDLYALFRLGAERIGCNISSTLYLKNRISFIESRKSGIRKAKQLGVTIAESTDIRFFWEILEENLMNNYKKKPVHNVNELSLLISKFPEKIKLFQCVHCNKVVAGCIVFIMNKIIHIQYISANVTGKSIGAIDLLFDELINRKFCNYEFFDFGQSTEESGNYLNENLIFQKEGFGGRGIVYEIYKYKI